VFSAAKKNKEEKMGNFTRDTFDKLKHYVGVRLQQGVPIVDADWNEQEDIHKFELQSFLKWFIGSGVPHGNNGFSIEPPSDGEDNDFTIKGGTADVPGRCLVEGWDVIIEDDIKYTEQILFTNPNNEADEWGVDPLQSLSPPLTGTRTDTVYLDVWEREVDSGEDNNLVHPAVKIETCVRIKREWVVRVAEGAPQPPGPPVGHVFYPLAYLNRTAGKIAIEEDDIIDLRRKNLSLYHLKENIESLAISVDTHNHSKLVGSDGTPDPALVVDNNGNVGIGTTNPEFSLDVPTNGWFRFGTGGDSGRIFAEYGTQFAPILKLSDKDDPPRIQFQQIGNSDENNPQFSSWIGHAQKKSSDIAVMGGNVGVGTTEPKNKMDVAGGAVIGSSYAGSKIAPANGLVVEGKMGIGMNPLFKFHQKGGDHAIENADISLRRNGSHRWRIQEKEGLGFRIFQVYDNNTILKNRVVFKISYNGNAGIGTDEPLTKLHVHGSSTFGDAFTPNSNCTSNIVNLIVGENDDGASNGIAFVETTTSGGYGMKLGYDGTLTGAKNALRFYNNLNNTIVTIENGGNVGIGTTSPQSKLHVKGNANVLNLEGTDHSYIQWYPDGYAAGRKAWTGYGGATTNTFTIKNQISGGNIDLSTTGNGRTFIRNISIYSGADYAEYFLSKNGKEIKAGTSVVMDNGKIRAAKKGEIPMGVISKNPGIVSGLSLEWPKKYLKDEFGCDIMEEYKKEIMVPKKEKVKKERQKVKKKKVKEEMVRTEVVKVKGKYCQKEISETVEKEVEEPVFKEVNLYDASGKNKIGKHQVPVMETYEEEIDVLDENGQPVMIGSGKFETKTRPKINPEYDKTKEYIPREKRPEWNCVGLLGQLPLRKGQPAAPTWVKIKKISKDVELWLVK
jgi:hypothetical protein